MIEIAFYFLALSSLIGWLLYFRARQQLGSLPRNYAAATETIKQLQRDLRDAEALAEQRLQRNTRLLSHVTRLTSTRKAWDILNPTTIEKPEPNKP